MFIEQPPEIVRKLYPSALWRTDPTAKTVCLTFDDGPIPEVTPWVLDVLARHGVKATFFMVGDNIRKHPDVFRQVVEQGHRIGNHTFHHLRGFENSSNQYLEDVRRAHDFMLEACHDLPPEQVEAALHPILFRPPHGHMTWGQYMVLRHHCRIVMWDLVTRDYSKKLRPPQVLANVMRYARNGSIITFHDSLKSWTNGNLPYALPRALDFLREEGYTFCLL
ncbi:polysaccharide deacetylase family protein [Bacteroides sp. ET71]|uniref:polysaccharide deacetylase family protein n=1 Tax=Bacteroides sp. ET71 TaxID=2939421 RepID=UPI0020139060|nr:polysaccharide deacetylase family protein [Bacteroides sp. ET71]MCL1616008.1 polysaccharide deacetylase family protein [Bacteroides sp. ET71]